MKRILIAVAAVISFFGFIPQGTAKSIEAQSKISAVTVYPGAAHVTREIAVDLPVGEHSIVLGNIVPQLDENSISVTGKGTAQVKIFGASIKKEFLTKEPNQRVQEILSKIEILEDQLVVANNDVEAINHQKEFLNSLNLFSKQQIPKDLVTKMPTVDELNGVMKFMGSSLIELDAKNEELRLKIRGLDKDKEALSRQLAELQNAGNQTERSIIVDLECVTPGNLILEVSYLVNGANWRPVYDARAKYDQEEVELSSYAMVQQTTGEDWQDVKLILSTAKPSLGGRMPRVDPWILQPYQPMVQREKDMGVVMARKAAMPAVGAQYDAFELKNEAAGAPPMQTAQVDYAQAVASGIAMEYKITRPAAVKSDGSEYRFPVATQNLKANFEYSMYPKAVQYAYLGSRVKNAGDQQLLAGQVNLFLDGAFVGKSSIDNIGPGEEFDLYLGVDESVKVERKQVSRKMDDVLIAGISSPNRTTTFQYKLSVENYKSKKIKAILFESMPVTENERIKVKVYDVSVPPVKKDWKDRKGVWRWEFELEPKAKNEIGYSFSVEHPRDMNIPGI